MAYMAKKYFDMVAIRAICITVSCKWLAPLRLWQLALVPGSLNIDGELGTFYHMSYIMGRERT